MRGKIFQSTEEPTVADRSLSRVINQKAIVNKVYQSDGISRAQLAKELGISKPAVTSNVEKLMEIGMLEERGEGEATKSGGRKPVMLYFNKNHGYVGAIDLSYRRPVCAIGDLKHNIIGLKKVHVLEDATTEERREEVKNTFLEILTEHGIDLGKLTIIVISHPGIIEEESNAYYAEKRHHLWTEIGLKDYLKDQMQVDIFIRNDVNLAAIGEINYNRDIKTKNLIYVSCGVGLGAGIIIDRKLYSGEGNTAGEIGALIMENRQSFEDYIAIDGLISRVELAYKENGKSQKVTFAKIVTLSRQNDEIVNKIIFETGRYLGRVFYNCCVILGIRTVVLGGEYLELGDKLFEGIEDVIKTKDVLKPEVVPSGLKHLSGILGCIVIGTEKIIERLINT